MSRNNPDFIVAFTVWGAGADPSDILDAAIRAAEGLGEATECAISEADVCVFHAGLGSGVTTRAVAEWTMGVCRDK